MYYKARQQKRNGKWYPQSVLHGRAVTTEELCDDIAEVSTVSHGDVLAVLKSLSRTMVKYLAEGRSVHLDGIGNFYLTANTKGNGVATEDEVSPDQINKVMVRFLAEKKSGVGGGKSSVPTLANTTIRWQKVEPKTKPTTNSGTETPTPDPTPGPDEG
jgi:predicted histone-like DNA-binding protein